MKEHVYECIELLLSSDQTVAEREHREVLRVCREYVPTRIRDSARKRGMAREGYLRRRAAAAYLDISQRTLSSWMSRRVIAHIKIGGVILFRKQDLDDAMTKFRLKAVGE